MVRHSGQNWYWGIYLSAVCWAYSLRARRQADNVKKKKCRPYLTMATLFAHLGKKMAYNVVIKSSETAIRECLHRSKAFMRASVLTGLKWQYLFVKAVFCE